jgi:S-adenosylmethionine-diacylgycerolhomoserine-N-methlytransferase
VAALAPGGELHIVDFGQQERLPGWFARFLKAWLRKFHVSPRADLRQVLASQASENQARLTFETISGGYAWRAVIVTKP